MKKYVNVLLGLSISAALCACGNTNKDINYDLDLSPEEVSAVNSSVEDTASSGESADNTTTDASGEASSDSSFYCLELEYDKENKIDLGEDGQMDTLLATGSDEIHYDLTINDQTIELINRDESNEWEMATSYFVHNSEGDFIISGLNDPLNGWKTTLYMWNNGSFEEIGSEPLGIMKDDNFQAEIFGDKVVLFDSISVLSTWRGTKDFTYGKDGFIAKDEKYFYAGDKVALTLKQDVAFDDDYEVGEAARTAAAGDTIYISCMIQDRVGFTSENGDFLGYLTVTQTDSGEYEVNGVNEYEMFDNILYAG